MSHSKHPKTAKELAAAITFANGEPIPQIKKPKSSRYPLVLTERELDTIEFVFRRIKLENKIGEANSASKIELFRPVLQAMGAKEADKLREAFNSQPYETVNGRLTGIAEERMTAEGSGNTGRARTAHYRSTIMKSSGRIRSNSGGSSGYLPRHPNGHSK